MTKIYTKTGDKGTTGLYGGKRVSKGEYQIEAYGTVDELNSNLGMLFNYSIKYFEREFLQKVQSDLFIIGSHLAKDPDKEIALPELKDQDITLLEEKIDEISSELPDLKSFVLPVGNIPSSYAHISRTICRRAERCVVRLNDEVQINPLIVKYLNRLSDLLFVLSRHYIIQEGKTEIPWIPQK